MFLHRVDQPYRKFMCLHDIVLILAIIIENNRWSS